MSKKETFWTIEFGFYPGILVGARTYRDSPFIAIHVIYIPFIDIAIKYISDVGAYNAWVSTTNELIDEETDDFRNT